MSPAVLLSASCSRPAAPVRQDSSWPRHCIAAACTLALLLPAHGLAAEAASSGCDEAEHLGPDCSASPSEMGIGWECSSEGVACGPDLSGPSVLMPAVMESTPMNRRPPMRDRSTEGALFQARLTTPLARGYLDAVLSARDGRQIEARGMGLQLRLPQHEGELMLGRYVSGGGGVRPDLPLVGMRYSSRALSPVPSSRAGILPEGARKAVGQFPAAPPSVGHRIALPGGAFGQPSGTLEVKLGELHGKAPARTLGGGSRLLPQGTSDVSLEAGLLARDAENFESTGIPTASLSLRHGVAAHQTLSARATRAGGSLLLAGLSEFRMMGLATAGATVRERGQGAEPGWLLTHEYQASGFNSRLRFEGLGGNAEPGGNGLLGTPSRRDAELSFTWALSPAQVFTLTAGDRIKLDGERAEVLGLSSSLRSRSGTQFSMGLKHAVDGDASTRFTLDWRIPLEGGKSVQRSARPWWSPLSGLVR